VVENNPLWDHQKEAILRATAEGVTNFALFMEMGTGKSRTLLEILRHHYNKEKKILRTVIVAPIIVLPNWKDEFKKFTKIPEDKIHILEGSIKSKADQLRNLDGIIVCNYDMFVRKEFTDALIEWCPKIVVLDESHKIKCPQAKRTKNILKLSQSMGKNGYRYILTGTPATNSQMDVWSQFFFLDHGDTFGAHFFGFRAAYFININQFKSGVGKNFPLYVAKKGIDEEINRRIKSKASIVKKEQCLTLPPFITVEIEVPMSPSQRKAYDAMKKDFITFINDKAAVASIALTKIIRMQQILSGFCKMEDDSIELFDSPRARILGELLSDISRSGKVICWSVFHQDYYTIRKVCEQHGLGYREIHGKLHQTEKLLSLKQFKEEKDVHVLIASPAAAGAGLNIVEAKYAVWFSRNFNLEQEQQASSRNHRHGSQIHSSITKYDLVCRGTLDEVILTALKDKKNMAANILQMDISKL
jgi:SNF2 family DNA or RNA helicase